MVSSDVSIHQPNVPTMPQTPADQEAGLLDILAIVRRRFWLIVFGIAVGMGLATLYYFKATPMYESKVEILVMPKDSPSPSASANGEFMQQSASEDTLATHMQLFQSPAVVRQAFEKNSLAKLPSLAKIIAEDGNPIKHIIDNLEVSRGGEGKAKDASVLAAVYTGPSPDDCAQILDSIVTSYQDFLGEKFQDTSSQLVDLIAKTMTGLAEELKQKQEEYFELRASTPLLWKGENSLNIHQERLASTEAALSEIAIRYTEAKSRLMVIEEALAKNQDMNDVEQLALLSASDTSRLELLLSATGHEQQKKDEWLKYREEDPIRQQSAQTEYDRLLTLLLEEATLMEDYGKDHPNIQTIREKIRLTRDFLLKNAAKPIEEEEEEEEDNRLKPAELLAAHVLQLKHDLSDLEMRREELESLADHEKEEAKKLATFELQDMQKSAELSQLRERHDAVVAKVSDFSLIKDYGGFLTEIISPVERAEAPSWPALPIVLALGGICGLFFGSGLAYVVELCDRTFRSPEELHHALGLPIMAHIPGTGVKRKKGRAAASANGMSAIDPSIVTAHRPASRFAEVFRGLRTALRFNAMGSACRVIQVTSANPRDGKTTVASNLAVSWAQAGKRVLLIDGDLRRPRIDAAFGLKTETGLADVLMGEAELLDAARPSGVENLWILPCGPRPSNPAELLSSREFEQLIEMVREHYDLVIIDSPPVLAVSDPAVIAPRVDGILLTVRITKHGRPEVIQAREILNSLDVKVLGVVVNGSGKNVGYGYGYGRKGYGYGHGYGYGYGYGYGHGGRSSSGNDDMNHYYGAEEKAAKV